MFGRSWLLLCHQSEVPPPGDHLDVDVLDVSMRVARDADGTITVVATDSRAVVSGASDTASALGRDPGAVGDLSLPTDASSEVPVELWHGLVFAHLGADPAPLAPSATAASAAIAPYRIEDMVSARTVELRDLPFNWKNMQENALEEYHTTFIHRGFHENVPADRVQHGPFDSGDGAVFRHAGMIIKGGEPVPGRPTFPVIEGLPEHERGHFVFLSVPPLMFAAVRPDGVKLFRIVPESVDRTTLSISFLFPPATLDMEDFDALLQRQVDLIDLIDAPDIDTNTRVHRGLSSTFAPRGPYSPQEASLPQFNRWLLDRYEAAFAAPVPPDGEHRPAPTGEPR